MRGPTVADPQTWTPGGAHPDREWLDDTHAALAWWGAQGPPGGVTSSITGLGAVAAAETRLSELHRGRAVLLTPNATFALLTALRVLEVGIGDEVLLPQDDWAASLGTVRLLGATPVPVATDPVHRTILPSACATARTGRTKAVIVRHFTTQPVDVGALKVAVPDLPIVEDCAAALGTAIAGRPVGTFGDFAVFSFGPGKILDAGEGGALMTASVASHRRALALATHPVRQALAGLPADAAQASMRPHPVAAVRVAFGLRDGLPQPVSTFGSAR